MTLLKKGYCNMCGNCCPNHCPDKSPNGLCLIHETKPKGCKIGPHNPGAMESGCSYWFFDVERKVVIVFDNFYDYPEEWRREWIEECIEVVTDG